MGFIPRKIHSAKQANAVRWWSMFYVSGYEKGEREAVKRAKIYNHAKRRRAYGNRKFKASMKRMWKGF